MLSIKTHIVRFFLAIAILAGIHLPVQTQNVLNELRFVDPKDKSVSFEFQFINNLIIVPVIINDSDTLHFILDTGINSSIMTELSIGDSLSLNYLRQIKLRGLGKGNPIDALHSTGNNFLISGIIGYNQDLYILLQNVFNLSSLLGTRVHGLLGYNIFKNFIVEINFSKKVITFHNPEYYDPRIRRRTVSIPLVIERTKPYIQGQITRSDGKIYPVKLLVDMGASHALWIDPESIDGFDIPARNIETFLGTGLSGEIDGKIGRLEALQIGSYTFEKVITAFPDSSSFAGALGLDDRNGSLGSEILRRFQVVMDYPNQRMLLTPNKFYSDPFNMNMTGIEVESIYPGLPIFQVSYVRKNSPGYRAGIRKGDEILSLNNSNISTYNINDIYELFESRPGRKIKMVVRRNGLRLRTIFYLEDRI
jgi:hypothetical protein